MVNEMIVKIGEEYQSTALGVMKVLATVVENNKRFLVLSTESTGQPVVKNADEFAKRIQAGFYTKVVKPKFKAGDRFHHSHLSHDLEVLTVSPEPTTASGKFSYFVKVVDRHGNIFYRSTSESLLDSCESRDWF